MREVSDLLIARLLSGKASAEESKEVLEWLNADHKNRLLYFNLKRIWQEDAVKEVDEDHLDHSWERLKLRMGKSEKEVKTPVSKSRMLSNFTKIAVAASIAILAGTTLFLSILRYGDLQVQGRLHHISVPLGSRSNIVLPDGTSVWLNSGSELSYSSDFGSRERAVSLTGEAYFDVVRDNKSPFLVHAGELRIKVLGTRFNVKSYPEEKIIETTLVRGMVEINPLNISSEVKPIVLKPNQKLTYARAEGSMSVAAIPEEKKEAVVVPEITVPKPGTFKVTTNVNPDVSTSWKDGKLIFEGEYLASLAPKLERFYNVKIAFQDESLKNYKYTGTLQEVTIEEVLRAIERTSSIRFEIDKNQVILKKSGRTM